MLNWGILAHPINWLTVIVMVFIGIMVVNLVVHPYCGHTTGPRGNPE